MRCIFFKVLNVLFFSSLFLGFVSCGEDDGSVKNGKNGEGDDYDTTVVDYSKHDIYVSLYYKDLNKENGNYIAAYWHKDSIKVLSDPEYDAYAYSVFVDGDDVYVGGVSNNAAVYWKNGEEIPLPQGTAVSSIYVRNGRVYACGHYGSLLGDIPMCWVDGSPIELSGGKRANSIFVDEDDNIYIAGFGLTQDYEDIIYYWQGKESNISKNAFMIGRTKVNNRNNPTSANGISATSDGSSFIVCGVETDNSARKFIAKQWINRRGHSLTLGENGTEARAAFVENGVFYVAGKEARKACYWKSTLKEDKMTVKDAVINPLSDGKVDTHASSIFVKDGVVYVVGYEAGDVKNKPLLWREKQKINFINSDAMNLDITTSGIYVTQEK
jgi:hypothetical protein